MTARTRIAVLASGHGSNLRALFQYFGEGAPARCAEIALVASNRTECGALALARERHVAAEVIAGREDDAPALAALLEMHRIDLIVLAGYLRLVPAAVARAFRGRIMNIHPALLPAFGGPGMFGERVHRAVIAAGVRVSGATVHFVDEIYDHGACIAQWPVPVYPGDSAATLARRILRVEHLLLPRAVHAVAAGTVRLDEAGHATGTFPPPDPTAAFTLLTREDADLARDITRLLSR